MKIIPNEQFFSMIESEIAEGRPVRFRLVGDSMYPLLRSGKDDVVLHPCTKEELQPMDIILFRFNGRHLLHRIIRIDGERLHIQGDGSIAATEECLKGDVIGKVHEVIRPGGKTISVNDRSWRLSSTLWRSLGPLRSLLLRVIFKLR